MVFTKWIFLQFLSEFDPKSRSVCLSGLNFGCGVGDLFNNAEET